MNGLEHKILRTYKEMDGKCEECNIYCKNHQLELHGPLSFFCVGNEFESDKYKVVFVGKTHWYNKKQVDELNNFENSIFKDCRNDCFDMFKNYGSQFWVYIRKIAEKLYPDLNSAENLLNQIVITNLTKCNTSEGSEDTTPFALTDRCIELFEKEIEIMNPKHLIFFTGSTYDNYISGFNFGFQNPPKDITSQKYRKKVGNRSTLWWERVFSDSKRSMNVLRTRHPVRAPSEFPEEIVSWIRTS